MKKFSKRQEKPNNVASSESSSQKLEDKLLELTDEEIETLFKLGKIDQAEYEYIMEFRKKKKEKKKTQKEKFEERIRCNNSIIEKVINLGRIFRVQEMFRTGKIDETKAKKDISNIEELLSDIDKDIEREERVRSKTERTRSKFQRQLQRDERNSGERQRDSGGRGR